MARAMSASRPMLLACFLSLLLAPQVYADTCAQYTGCVSPLVSSGTETDCVGAEGCDTAECCGNSCLSINDAACATKYGTGYVSLGGEDYCINQDDCESQCCQATCANVDCGTKQNLGSNHWCTYDTNETDEMACSVANCCADTCGSFDCGADAKQRVKIDNAGGTVCGAGGCSYDICCVETCAIWEEGNNCPTGYNPLAGTTKCSDNVCTASDQSTCCERTCAAEQCAEFGGYVQNTDSTSVVCVNEQCDPDVCCKKTCATYTTACTDSTTKNKEDVVCPPGGCTEQSCCLATCAQNPCGPGQTLIANAGNVFCTGGTCTKLQCCTDNSCGPDFDCTTAVQWKERVVPPMCPNPTTTACNYENCCNLKTCGEVHTDNSLCGSNYKVAGAVECQTTGCDANTYCCKPTCTTFESQCQPGQKLQNGGDICYNVAAGTFTCTSTQCCQPKVCGADFQCTGGYTLKNPLNPPTCGAAGCNTDTCCTLQKCDIVSGCTDDTTHKVDTTKDCPESLTANCDGAYCCQRACRSHTCSPGFRDKAGKADIFCTSGTCSDDLCCERKKCEDGDGFDCNEAEGYNQLATSVNCLTKGCTRKDCCQYTCKSYSCRPGLTNVPRLAVVCPNNVCTASKCCVAQTCTEWDAVAGNECPADHVLKSKLKCPSGGCSSAVCCQAKCKAAHDSTTCFTGLQPRTSAINVLCPGGLGTCTPSLCCADVNECAAATPACENSAFCKNIWPADAATTGYACKCRSTCYQGARCETKLPAGEPCGTGKQCRQGSDGIMRCLAPVNVVGRRLSGLAQEEYTEDY